MVTRDSSSNTRPDAAFTYASRATADFDSLEPHGPTDPSPVEYRNTALFALSDGETARGVVDGDLLADLGAAAGGFVLDRYERGGA